MPRTFYLFFFLLLTGPLQAQDNHFVIETGLVYGATDDFLGFNREGEYDPSWSIKVGRASSISSKLDIVWGVRYSFIPDVAHSQTYNLLLGDRLVITRSRLRQHYVSLPVHFQHHINQFYLFMGPEIGFAIRSSLSTDEYWTGVNGPEEEHQTLNVTGAFSDFNAMITIGMGTEWRIGNQILYSQLSVGQTMVSRDVIEVRYRSGYTREFFFSTGIRL